MVIDGGLRVRVRLTPKAARTVVTGLRAGAGGEPALAASVTAVPEKGRANAALVKLLAKEWGVAKSAIGIAAGASARDKTVHIAGDGKALATRLARWADDKLS